MEKGGKTLKAGPEKEALSGKKKKSRERKRVNMAGTQRQSLALLLPRFHPSGLGFYAGFSLQMAALEAWCCTRNSGQGDTPFPNRPKLLYSVRAYERCTRYSFAV